MNRRLLSFFFLFFLLIFTTGCGKTAAEKEAAEPVTLKAWAVYEDRAAFGALMDAYRAVHSNVSFELRILRPDEYESELWRAFAMGEGPDLFAIHNTWVGEYKDLISPLPSVLSIPYTEVKKSLGLKEEKITVLREEKTMTEQELKNNYIDVVYNDVLRDYQPEPNKESKKTIFGLPLSVDTLVLFSNTDLLDAASIAEPPETWQQFQDQVKLLTKVDSNGKVTQSAAAFGTGKNIERASDILSVLMLQDGTTMERGEKAVFSEGTKESSPGADALRFYTDFANPLKDVYTWTPEMSNSLEAFINGETAFFFGYSYHPPTIKAESPKINLRLSKLPQIEGGRVVNFANYWLWTASKASANTKWAWDFILFASKKENVKTYLESTNRPTALRGLINEQSENEDVSVFVSQLLTAESWYHGKDAGVMEAAFNSMIEEALAGAELPVVIKEAQNKVNQTY